MNNIHYSNYVTVTLGVNCLIIDITDDGKKYALERLEEINHFELFYELMEYVTCNGLVITSGDQIDGWLTGCDIIGEDIHYGDNDDIVLEGAVYTNIQWYQVHSNYDMMLRGQCIYRIVR